ncbi:hypothetical protein M747DRAFT_34856 [Aspergillus niger ATCC 13496]|uniref:Uncharacterized protein n=1 Tax=Aspergillus niger ATCC 13496 TaxID=1353008 RepID=A0A370C433_ASPNG|nr:hypothetical protein M747DRAFT_34856 [Aspergillus niger ATCC 13496]
MPPNSVLGVSGSACSGLLGYTCLTPPEIPSLPLKHSEAHSDKIGPVTCSHCLVPLDLCLHNINTRSSLQQFRALLC